MASAPEPAVGRPSRAFAWLVIAFGWLVVPAVVVAAVVAWHELPGLSALPESGVTALLPSRTAAVETEREATTLFGSSLLARIAVVQRNPNGITLRQQRQIVGVAIRLDRGRLEGFPRGSRALPYSNAFGIAPGASERGTTVITYLGFPSNTAPGSQRTLADRYAGLVSVSGAHAAATGFIPGSMAQSDAVDRGLPWVTLAAILLIAAILALYLRSIVAPLVALAAAGLAYVLAVHVMAWLASRLGVEIQHEVEPIVVVLLLAVVTDYSVFLLSGARAKILEGERPRPAVRRATAEVLPIIVTAGLVVAAGLATLRLAGIGFVSALGPAMAIVVLVGLAVSVLFVPAVMGLLGRLAFWPGLREGADAHEPLTARAGAWLRRVLANGTSRRLGAIPTLVLAATGLVAAASGLSQMQLALTPIRGLPAETPASRADRQASLGFAPGVIAPTELVVRGRDIGFRAAALKTFGRTLRAEPEVAAVVGAALPTLPRAAQPIFRSRTGDAVRYFVAFEHHPYGSAGIDDLHRLQRAMPRLLAGAGLSGATVGYAGDTAMAAETTGLIGHDLLVVGIAATLANLVLLALFLRSLVAALLLVGTSLLGVAATIGLTAYATRTVLGTADITYYVPLAVGVLLFSLGTDYNLFIVGRIWQESDRGDIGTAIRAAVPRAGRAISIAALALAGSFATLWIIPIAPFRTFAFAVCVGVLIDAFIVRTLMIPALLASFGNASQWPSRRAAAKADARSEPPATLPVRDTR